MCVALPSHIWLLRLVLLPFYLCQRFESTMRPPHWNAQFGKDNNTKTDKQSAQDTETSPYLAGAADVSQYRQKASHPRPCATVRPIVPMGQCWCMGSKFDVNGRQTEARSRSRALPGPAGACRVDENSTEFRTHRSSPRRVAGFGRAEKDLPAQAKTTSMGWSHR